MFVLPLLLVIRKGPKYQHEKNHLCPKYLKATIKISEIIMQVQNLSGCIRTNIHKLRNIFPLHLCSWVVRFFIIGGILLRNDWWWHVRTCFVKVKHFISYNLRIPGLIEVGREGEHWLEPGSTVWPRPLTSHMTLEFSRSNFEIAVSQEFLI